MLARIGRVLARVGIELHALQWLRKPLRQLRLNKQATGGPNAQDQKQALFVCIGGFIRSRLLNLVVSLKSAGD